MSWTSRATSPGLTLTSAMPGKLHSDPQPHNSRTAKTDSWSKYLVCIPCFKIGKICSSGSRRTLGPPSGQGRIPSQACWSQLPKGSPRFLPHNPSSSYSSQSSIRCMAWGPWSGHMDFLAYTHPSVQGPREVGHLLSPTSMGTPHLLKHTQATRGQCPGCHGRLQSWPRKCLCISQALGLSLFSCEMGGCRLC